MKISSPVFGHNEAIPSKYTCDGENVNPSLVISGVPPGAKSLVLIMDDPDVPRGTWVHWILWNIKPDVSEIFEASVPPDAIEGRTSFGRPGWGGPCPPFNPDQSVGAGTHRYFFKLYALNTFLNIPPSADKAALEKAMSGAVMESAELIGLYSRSR